MNPTQALLAISPVDGRYFGKTKTLSPYFSEFALMRYRVEVEILYFIALCKLPLPQLTAVKPQVFENLKDIYRNFSMEDALKIKQIEATTNHDVKAVEYFIKQHFYKLGLSEFKEFIHFGLTSQDINNTAIPLSIKRCLHEIFLPQMHALLDVLKQSAADWSSITMLARTHGQPASPTKLGKEIAVFCTRLEIQLNDLQLLNYPAKFGGATGNFNAHYVAYPSINWHDFAVKFVEDELGLSRSFPTTQIEHYDRLATIFDNLRRINVILLDLCKDIWAYVSMNYFTQKIKAGEVGSSAMPHKVNPIDFENAEGNLGLANALYAHFSEKLPISRLQRDLTDSTVLRNIGVPIAHSLLSIQSITNGWQKLQVNEKAIQNDLEENWAVVAEAIQTILRREGYPEPYEALKELTRTHEKITKSTIQHFVATLHVSESVKAELLAISPFSYTGN